MIKSLYTVFDKKASFYVNPFCARSEGEAIRMIEQALRDPNTSIHQHPEDFQLVHIGSFDDNTSEIQYSPPHIIAEAADLKTQVLQDFATPPTAYVETP